MEVSELLSHLQNICKPDPNQTRIYKDECVFSFDTPESDSGLYLCLKTYLGIGKDYIELYHHKTGNSVFLNIKRTKKELPPEQQGDGPEKKVTRLAIGVEGGFDPDAGKSKYEYEESYSLVIMPGFHTFPWPVPELPKSFSETIQVILDADSAAKLAELQSLTETWDGEMRVVSKHAENLLQLDNGVRVPPTGWVCEKCDLTQNLWMNLTDGKIMCGRKFYDGSGGNDHAVQHYRETGYPLAVKLGTITKEGKADVYSYEEDDMVEDPLLVKHLAHFGINIAQLEKTDKSMAELELDLNQRFGEWVAMQESSSKLTPLYGPGHTGLVNLGNSCYLNSVMQIIFSIPDFKKRFVENGLDIIKEFPPDPATDFNVQMAKLGLGLWSGKYSKTPPEDAKENDCQPGIKPLMFKTLMGRGHPDFSSKRQQDAQEFFLHFINVLERNSRHRVNPADCFKFKVEDKFQCSKSQKVKYTHRTEYSLPLPIPLEAAINKEEVAAYEESQKRDKEEGLTAANRSEPKPIVRPRIKLEACLDTFSRSETVDFYSTAVNQNTSATKTTRLASFPDYLLLHLKKFTLRENWTSVKLDVAVEMPDEIDLASLAALGPQPDEEQLPEIQGSPPAVTLDENMIQQLIGMGFHVEACKKAVFYTQSNGRLEAAVQWLMDHFGDFDFEEKFVLPGTDRSSGGGSQSMEVDEDGIQTIMGMGFTRAQAVKALRATGNNIERAADWIFSHLEELDAVEEEAAEGGGEKHPSNEANKGSSRYRLLAFISHMGTSTMVGHYVCHVLRDGRWVIFNDNKVALSENPPKELGYLYLYERI
ncbi:ubiquitin carboxyl-terminal hydrolase 5 [Hetaerina americana]|uniref:ubiquitin carboxyl-terminal hydrolase 5 n=1 Tax=Hetaerina americana TaxID=62018 RepID=UPI003A7F5155